MSRLLLIIVLFSCNAPDGVMHGREYWVNESCVKSHREKETAYHWGYYYVGHDAPGFGGHFPYQCFNSCTKWVCDEHQYDTIWGKNMSSSPAKHL